MILHPVVAAILDVILNIFYNAEKNMSVKFFAAENYQKIVLTGIMISV